MSVSTLHTEEPETFGNFRRPKSYALGNLGILASIMVIIGAIGGVILLFLAGLLPAFVYAVFCSLIIATLAIKDRHERSTLEKIAAKLTWLTVKSKGENVYRSGPLTRFGTALLPGLLARTTLDDYLDTNQRPFGLLSYDKTADHVVVLKCSPDGSSLQDPFDTRSQIDRWGKWLVQAAHEDSLKQAQVTIQSSPDHGSALKREVDLHKAPTASPLSQQIFEEHKADLPTGAALISSHCALTFSGAGRKRRNREAMVKLLASRIPALSNRLATTGAGVCTPMEAAAIAQYVRVAYNPKDGDLISEALAKGEKPRDLVVEWANAGPIAFDETWDHLRHDSGLSVTWVMTGIHGDVLASALEPLLHAHPDIPVKRVSIIYKPKSPDRSAITAEKDKKNAHFRVSSAKTPSARAHKDLAATTAVAHDEAKGAALVDFTIVITATVRDTEQLPDALAAIDVLAPSARLQIRQVYGAQATAFTQGLPVGMVASEHGSVPTSIREGL